MVCYYLHGNLRESPIIMNYRQVVLFQLLVFQNMVDSFHQHGAIAIRFNLLFFFERL